MSSLSMKITQVGVRNFKVTNENIDSLSNLAFNTTDVLEMNEYKVVLAKNLVKKLLLKLIQ